VIAQFSIYPLQTEHMSKDIAKVLKVLDETGLKYRLGPIGTCVEGELGNVLDAIKRCHQSAMSSHGRVITTIVIDDSEEPAHDMAGMVTSVERKLGHPVRG